MTAHDPASSSDAPDLRQVLRQITERMSEFMGVERSTVFLYDEEKEELWTPAAQGLDGADEIRVKLGQGIAGSVMASGESLRIDDPYNDPRFFADVDRRSGFRTRNLFCRPIFTTDGRRIGVIQLLNKAGGPLGERDEALLDILCAQAGIAIENAQLYHRLKAVRESEQSLHGELKAKHAELQKAFIATEHATMQHDLLERRMKKLRVRAIAGIFLLFGALGLFAWFAGGSQTAGTRASPGSSTDDGALAWHTVSTVPVETTLSLLGNIEPLEIRHITSPFRGRVAERGFEYGELVTKGQVLARIDATELEVELRNARTAAFRASTELKRLVDWKSSPEVARADRALLKARLNFEGNERNLKELEQLSSLGIIAASTLESARQQFTTQQADYRAAEEDLANVLSLASEERVTIARYDVENTSLRVRDLEEKLGRATIVAPFSGIVILPNSRPIPNRNRDNDGFFEAGTTINQGEVLVSLGNLEGVAVRTRADEVDVARLKHGQRVRITGDAFAGTELRGEVAYLSSQAILTSGRPYFEVGVKTGNLDGRERAVVRLGMTARVEILVYERPEAIVVPVSAVITEDGSSFVWRRAFAGSKASGLPQRRPVTCGLTTLTGVEIIDGLVPGDLIAVNAASVEAPGESAP